jgi:acetyl esterase
MTNSIGFRSFGWRWLTIAMVCALLAFGRFVPATQQSLAAAAPAATATAPTSGDPGETEPATRPKLPKPDLADVHYGPDERNVMDVWLAKSDHPTPFVLFYHGGGFRAGDKSLIPGSLIAICRKAGISVASASYRLSPQVAYPQHYLDCARALQFARHSAKEWNIDPTRVALSGSSAGGGTSLWLAFHDDLADPKNDDPILRESTRVSCAMVFAAQCTYDPDTIRQIAGEAAAHHPALPDFVGVKPDELDSEKAHKLFTESAAITWLTKDDPPVFAYYSEPRGPVPADAKPGTGIHSPAFGDYLKQKMDALNIECIVHVKATDGASGTAELKFLQEHLLK